MPWSTIKSFQPSVGFDDKGYWCSVCGALRKPCKHFPSDFVQKEVSTSSIHHPEERRSHSLLRTVLHFLVD